MLDAFDIAAYDYATPSRWKGEARRQPACRNADGSRRLATNDLLFQKGDTRNALYRVESGAICHFVVWEDGRHEVIEFAFPGDIVGLGHLDTHISTAEALVDTTVSHVSPATFERELATDGQLAARLAIAADREFEFLKTRALAANRKVPLQRLASLLAALSGLNGSEGRDATLIGDEFTSGFIADRLGMTVPQVAHTLVELENKGVVASSAGGLRLTNIVELERLAAA